MLGLFGKFKWRETRKKKYKGAKENIEKTWKLAYNKGTDKLSYGGISIVRRMISVLGVEGEMGGGEVSGGVTTWRRICLKALCGTLRGFIWGEGERMRRILGRRCDLGTG